MTGREFWTRAAARSRATVAQREEGWAIAAQQTATLVQWLVAPYVKEGADPAEVFPSALRLFEAWTGKAKPPEEQEEDRFYTPELEGEEVQWDLSGELLTEDEQ